MVLALLVALVLVAADQGIKYWVVGSFALGESREFLHFGKLEIMRLTYVQNEGAAFSSLSGQRAILIALPVILLIGCCYALIKYGRENKTLRWLLILIMSGGIGNLLDRIFRGGKVVDYLDLQLFDFAVFNFADCCICVGTVCLLVYYMFIYKEPKPAAVAQAHSAETQEKADA